MPIKTGEHSVKKVVCRNISSPNHHHRQRLHAPIHPHEAFVHAIWQAGGFPAELVLARGEFAGEEVWLRNFDAIAEFQAGMREIAALRCE